MTVSFELISEKDFRSEKNDILVRDSTLRFIVRSQRHTKFFSNPLAIKIYENHISDSPIGSAGVGRPRGETIFDIRYRDWKFTMNGKKHESTYTFEAREYVWRQSLVRRRWICESDRGEQVASFKYTLWSTHKLGDLEMSSDLDVILQDTVVLTLCILLASEQERQGLPSYAGSSASTNLVGTSMVI